MGFDVHSLRDHCLAKPGATEHIQWGDHLVFKVGGKVFVITAFEPVGYLLSCKCKPEEFDEWTEMEGVVQAPYLAKRHWVALEKRHGLTRSQIRRLADRSYELVFAGLTKKSQTSILAAAKSGAASSQPKKRAK